MKDEYTRYAAKLKVATTGTNTNCQARERSDNFFI